MNVRPVHGSIATTWDLPFSSAVRVDGAGAADRGPHGQGAAGFTVGHLHVLPRAGRGRGIAERQAQDAATGHSTIHRCKSTTGRQDTRFAAVIGFLPPSNGVC